MRRWSITAFALLASASIATAGWACGFEDPKSVPAQQVVLGLIYPNALYVQGAVDSALRGGVLGPEHFAPSTDPSALYRTASNLRRFAGGLAVGPRPDLPAFSLVLMGPVMWTQFRPGSDGLVTDIHTSGPLADSAVVVSDVPALVALVSGDVSGSEADALGLVRFYGDPAEIDELREALALAFPGGFESRAQAPAGLATFRFEVKPNSSSSSLSSTPTPDRPTTD